MIQDNFPQEFADVQCAYIQKCFEIWNRLPHSENPEHHAADFKQYLIEQYQKVGQMKQP